MVVSDKNEHDPIQQIPKAPKEFIKPSTPPVISKTIPVQLTGKEKRKKLLKGLAEKDKIEAEKRKLREEIQKKDKEINRLNALLKQYEYLLIDEPEQECFIHL
ncbi:hypothetical protein G6F56_012902 [Rhizopus delemar]|nr:hypothetical protein G6F56_012902 [Rhizopus delemar]